MYTKNQRDICDKFTKKSSKTFKKRNHGKFFGVPRGIFFKKSPPPAGGNFKVRRRQIPPLKNIEREIYIKNNTFDLVIVGGGAAGILAAIAAAKADLSVCLLEKNRKIARKILISGKGRCNLTNNCGIQDFVKNINSGSKFLYSTLNQFSPQDAIRLFESMGIPLKTERGNRVFPQSDKAIDIVDALFNCAIQSGVEIKTSSNVTKIAIDNNTFRIESDEIYKSKALIIATGGLSYPLTGSTGDGYRFAQEFGHSIVAPHPGLVPIETVENWDLQGLSLRNVKLSLFRNNKAVYSDLGEMMFTHFGITGPLVLTASSLINPIEIKSYKFELDLKPALDEKTLDLRLQRDIAKYINRNFINIFDDLLPAKLIPVFVKQTRIPPEQKANSITKESRRKIVRLLKHLPITPLKLRNIEEAIITIGGVNLREINPKTMESKLVPNLYFAGELLDIDALTGGFNLQIAFGTGIAAATAVIDRQKNNAP